MSEDRSSTGITTRARRRPRIYRRALFACRTEQVVENLKAILEAAEGRSAMW